MYMLWKFKNCLWWLVDHDRNRGPLVAQMIEGQLYKITVGFAK